MNKLSFTPDRALWADLVGGAGVDGFEMQAWQASHAAFGDVDPLDMLGADFGTLDSPNSLTGGATDFDTAFLAQEERTHAQGFTTGNDAPLPPLSAVGSDLSTQELPQVRAVADDDDCAPPPPPSTTGNGVPPPTQDAPASAPAIAARRPRKRPTSERRVERRIAEARKGISAGPNSISKAFEKALPPLSVQMKRAHAGKPYRKNGIGARIEKKATVTATVSKQMAEMGRVAANLYFLQSSTLCGAETSAMTGNERKQRFSLHGSGKMASILDTSVEDLLKLTARAESDPTDAAKKVTLRALIEGAVAAVPYPNDPENQVKLVGADDGNVSDFDEE